MLDPERYEPYRTVPVSWGEGGHAWAVGCGVKAVASGLSWMRGEDRRDSASCVACHVWMDDATGWWSDGRNRSEAAVDTDW